MVTHRRVATQRHGSTCFHIILTKKKNKRERERERERERQQIINRDIEESCIVCVLLLCYFFNVVEKYVKQYSRYIV